MTHSTSLFGISEDIKKVAPLNFYNQFRHCQFIERSLLNPAKPILIQISDATNPISFLKGMNDNEKLDDVELSV
jgi:hypothetical protein